MSDAWGSYLALRNSVLTPSIVGWSALDRLLDHVDADRMDILDTLIRVTLQEVDADLMHGILALRPWEHLVRTQLAAADGPGRLFSPLDIPDDF